MRIVVSLSVVVVMTDILSHSGMPCSHTSEAARSAAFANTGTTVASPANISPCSRSATKDMDARARRSHSAARACDGG